jgi:superfamily II DNA or RNA helicase
MDRELEQDISRAEAHLAKLEEERDRAVRRLSELRARRSPPQPKDERGQTSNSASPRTSAEKIATFMNLFRGRPDVHARRWTNRKKGTKGFAPACANEWMHGVCDKPRVKCGACPNQAFLPCNEEAIRNHLKGRHAIGVYPMLPGDTCWFLALDFDKGTWREDVAAFVETCSGRGLQPAIERSQSGEGAHVWFFFSAAVPAIIARRFGCSLLTETMTRRHQLSMSSYDRLFPNQDTIARGGFGNLIALPFQDGARQEGNSVFVDRTWTPFPDQWAFLSSVRRMGATEVAAIAREAVERGEVIGARVADSGDGKYAAAPWNRPPSGTPSALPIDGPLPTSVQAVLSQRLFVELEGLPTALISRIKRLAAFQNPEFYKKQALRLSTALTPCVISCAEEHPRHVGLPRGSLDDLRVLLDDLGIELSIEDRRTEGEELGAHFHGKLTSIQEKAASALLEHDIGVFVAPPGSGKTVVGANLIARRRRSTLVIVHRTQLLEQWRAQLAVFLDLRPKDIGQVGGGKRKPNGILDIAMIQSLARKEKVSDIVAQYGQVIVDECHHVPAVSFERVMREVKARYVVGLTATPQRRDGHHPILRLQLGPTRFRIDARSQAAGQSFRHRLVVRETAFRLRGEPSGAGIQEVYRQIAEDANRNRLILRDVARALEEGRSPILLTERRDHLLYFSERLSGIARHLVILQGGMRTRERRAAIEQLASIPESEERLVLATGRFIGEGFDDARLDTLFLAMPVSWKGTLIQYAGRLHRRHRAKTEVRMVDYVDRGVPMLARMFEKRMRGYAAMGYAVEGRDAGGGLFL